MDPRFILLFWLLVAAIVGAVGAGAVVLFMVARRKQWVAAKWISGTLAAAIAAAVLGAVGLICYGFVRTSVPRFVFEDTFKRPVPPNVRNIQTKTWWFADKGITYMSFTAERETFERLVPPGLVKVSPEELKRRGWKERTVDVDWWTPLSPEATEIYFLTSGPEGGRTFNSETTLMTYHPGTQRAYYHFLGLD